MSTAVSQYAREEFAGEELEILARLGIPNADTSRHRICPFPDHDDHKPSWRWDSGKVRWFCTCGHGDIIDAIAKRLGCNFKEARDFARSGRARPSERELGKRQREAEARQREQEARQALDQAKAAEHAQAIWRDAAPAPADHPYLMAKGIKPGRLRFSAEPVDYSSWSQTKPNVLIVPIYSIDREIVNVECIDADGRKTFLHHDLLKGCFSPIGQFKGAGTILIATGWATSASLHEATSLPCAAAFSDTNLEAVAVALRREFAASRLAICGDDDWQTKGNPGKEFAHRAAAAVAGLAILPDFHGVPDRKRKESDFNDVALRLGAAAVRQQFQTFLSR